MDGCGLKIPEPARLLDDETVAFAAALIDRSAVASHAEAALARPTGRRRCLPVRAVLAALLLLAIDDRPLHLTDHPEVARPGCGSGWRSRSRTSFPPAGTGWSRRWAWLRGARPRAAEPYVNHLLRVAIRILSHYLARDPDLALACAAYSTTRSG